MSVHAFVSYAFWIVPALLQLAITVKMYRVKIIREFPFFSTYTVVHVIRFLVLFPTSLFSRPPYAGYFYGYWSAEALDVVLGIAVIYELYSHVFGEYQALRRLGNVLFQWSAAMLLLAAVAMAAMTTGSDTSRVIAGIMVAEQCFAFIRAGLLLFLFLFARAFGLTWRHYIVGIALGFAVYVSVDMAAAAIRGNIGSIANATYALIKTGAYNCTAVIWMMYFLQKKPASTLVQTAPTADLKNWNAALQQLLNR